MGCLPMWGEHGVQPGAGFVMAADSRDKRHSGSSTSKSKPQAAKPTRKGGHFGAGGNTRGSGGNTKGSTR